MADKPKLTPEQILRMRDTSGVEARQHTCIKCKQLYTPGTPDTGVCKDCGGQALRTQFKAPDADPAGTVRCLLCAKLYEPPISIGKVDQVCSDCKKGLSGTAKLVCSKCGITICRLTPKVMDDGFVIQPSAVLHSDSCNICKPGLTESTIVEITLWQKHLRPKKAFVPQKR
jgi:hypothetical protein